MALPLTEATLEEVRRKGQKPGARELGEHVYALFGIDKEPPPVYVVPPPKNNPRLIGGRFFPEERAILIYENEDPEITTATGVHELCHAASYEKRCGSVPRTKARADACEYVGQHDKGSDGYALRDDEGNVVARARTKSAAYRASRRMGRVGSRVTRARDDGRFYDLLEQAHKDLGVSTRAARAVEGNYSYPSHWRESNWR